MGVEVHARIARTYPSLFRALFLCRSKEKVTLMQDETDVPATCSLKTCEEFHPDLVVVAVNKQNIADVCIEWAGRGYPVLTETPVGFKIEQLQALWDLHQNGAKIAVSEQYHRYPELIAGLEAVAQGKIGNPGSAYLSLAHDYHGISLIRRMLLADGESYVLHGERIPHPVTETDSRTGPIPGNPVRVKNRDVICVTYDSGKQAVYDFSGVQYHSFIRSRHLIVRGGGPCFYTLREALDDAYFRILMEQAVAEPWKEVRTEKMPWTFEK